MSDIFYILLTATTTSDCYLTPPVKCHTPSVRIESNGRNSNKWPGQSQLSIERERSDRIVCLCQYGDPTLNALVYFQLQCIQLTYIRI